MLPYTFFKQLYDGLQGVHIVHKAHIGRLETHMYTHGGKVWKCVFVESS